MTLLVRENIDWCGKYPESKVNVENIHLSGPSAKIQTIDFHGILSLVLHP